MDIVLRVSGTDASVEALLRHMPIVRIEASWKAGEVRLKRPAEEAGFNLLLSDANDPHVATAEAEPGLARLAASLSGRDSPVVAEIDVALYVYAMRMASVFLPLGLLKAALDAGIPIRVSAYPCSDEEEGGSAPAE
jgi:hypothetical protein